MDFSDDEDLIDVDFERIENEASRNEDVADLVKPVPFPPASASGSPPREENADDVSEQKGADSLQLQSSPQNASEENRLQSSKRPSATSGSSASSHPQQKTNDVGETTALTVDVCDTCRSLRKDCPTLFPDHYFKEDVDGNKDVNGVNEYVNERNDSSATSRLGTRIRVFGSAFETSDVFAQAQKRSKIFGLFYKHLPDVLKTGSRDGDSSWARNRQFESTRSFIQALDLLLRLLLRALSSFSRLEDDDDAMEVEEVEEDDEDDDNKSKSHHVDWSDECLFPLIQFVNRLLLEIRLHCDVVFHRRSSNNEGDDKDVDLLGHAYLCVFWRLIAILTVLTKQFGLHPSLSRGTIVRTFDSPSSYASLSSSASPSDTPQSLLDHYVYLFISDSVALLSRHDVFRSESSSSERRNCSLIDEAWKSLFRGLMMASSHFVEDWQSRTLGLHGIDEGKRRSDRVWSLARLFLLTCTEGGAAGNTGASRETVNGASDVHSTDRWWRRIGGSSSSTYSVSTTKEWKNECAFALFAFSKMCLHIIIARDHRDDGEDEDVAAEEDFRKTGLELTKTLLKRALTYNSDGGSSRLSAKDSRLLTSSLAHLVVRLGPDYDTLGLLWDQFVNDINRDFELVEEEVSPMSMSRNSNLANLDYQRSPEAVLKSLRDGGQETTTSPKNYDVFTSSFRQFLGLIAETRRMSSTSRPLPPKGSSSTRVNPSVDPSVALVAARKWKSFKGKVYIKLHRRRIAGLEASGLANLAELFLALALMAENQDEEREYVKKFCGFARDVDKLDGDKLHVIFRSLLTFLLLQLETTSTTSSSSTSTHGQAANSALDDLVDALNSSVEKSVQEMKNLISSHNPAIKQAIKATSTTNNLAAWWRVIRFYFDSLGDILAGGKLSVEHSRRLLFYPGTVLLLGSFTTMSDLKSIFNLFCRGFKSLWIQSPASFSGSSALNDKINNNSINSSNVNSNVNSNNNSNNNNSNSISSFANNAWDELSPQLLRLGASVLSSDVASVSAQLLIDFVLLSKSYPPSRPLNILSPQAGDSQKVIIRGPTDLIEFVTGSKRIAFNVLTAFLERILSSSSLDVATLTWTLLSTWFRFQVFGRGGAASMTAPLSTEPRRLSHLLFQYHPTVAKICKHLNPDFITVQSFLHAFGTSSEPEARTLLISLCREFLQWAANDMKSGGVDEARVNLLYKSAHLFLLLGSSALFTKSDPQCLLISVVNRFLLPRSFLSGESPRLLVPIRDSLPLFLSSLVTLLAKSNEAKFLENKIAEIVFWHLHKFAGDGGGGGKGAGVGGVGKGGGGLGGVGKAGGVGVVGKGGGCGPGMVQHPLMTTLTMTLVDSEKAIRDKAEDILVTQIGSTWISEMNPDLLEKLAPPSSPLLPLQFLHHLLHHNKSKSDLTTAKGHFLAQRFVRSSLLLLRHIFDSSAQRFTAEESRLLSEIVVLIISSTKDSSFLGASDRKIFSGDVVEVVEAAVKGSKFTAQNHQQMRMLDAIAASNSSLIVDCIPSILQAVYRVESRRGIGADAAMRRRVAALFQRLGDKGREAAVKLAV